MYIYRYVFLFACDCEFVIYLLSEKRWYTSNVYIYLCKGESKYRKIVTHKSGNVTKIEK